MLYEPKLASRNTAEAKNLPLTRFKSPEFSFHLLQLCFRVPNLPLQNPPFLQSQQRAPPST
jgi:hypothetical protein